MGSPRAVRMKSWEIIQPSTSPRQALPRTCTESFLDNSCMLRITHRPGKMYVVVVFVVLGATLGGVDGVTSAEGAQNQTSWAVHIKGGLEKARSVAHDTGSIFIGPVGTLKDLYHFSRVRSSTEFRSILTFCSPMTAGGWCATRSNRIRM